jgi:hypothetical protein
LSEILEQANAASMHGWRHFLRVVTNHMSRGHEKLLYLDRRHEASSASSCSHSIFSADVVSMFDMTSSALKSMRKMIKKTIGSSEDAEVNKLACGLLLSLLVSALCIPELSSAAQQAGGGLEEEVCRYENKQSLSLVCMSACNINPPLAQQADGGLEKLILLELAAKIFNYCRAPVPSVDILRHMFEKFYHLLDFVNRRNEESVFSGISFLVSFLAEQGGPQAVALALLSLPVLIRAVRVEFQPKLLFVYSFLVKKYQGPSCPVNISSLQAGKQFILLAGFLLVILPVSL